MIVAQASPFAGLGYRHPFRKYQRLTAQAGGGQG